MLNYLLTVQVERALRQVIVLASELCFCDVGKDIAYTAAYFVLTGSSAVRSAHNSSASAALMFALGAQVLYIRCSLAL
jgi:hypothetical protein